VAEVLELGLDARPMEQGAAQAKRAIDSVSDSALKSQAAISKAFQTTGGAVQVAGGIAQTAKAFSELNVSAGAFGASRALLEIGKTVQDFRELRGAVGASGSAFSVLGTILRAHPLMTLVTVLSTIGGLMSLFSRNTKEAASSFDQLAASMQKAQLSNRARQALGLPTTNQGQADVIAQAMERSLAGEAFNLQQFGPQGYGGGADVARYLATRGTEAQQAAAREYLRTGGQNVTRYYAAGMQGTQVTQFQRGLPNVPLTPSQAQDVLRMRYESLQPQQVEVQTGTGDRYGVGSALEQATQMASIVALNEKRKLEASQRITENMERAANYAGNIGSTVGAAFADVLMKTTTLRQAFAGIVASIARQGLADIGAAIFKGAVQGLTPTQTGQNTGAKQ
jgi:hypothetical protein